jgi:hypothetical protein
MNPLAFVAVQIAYFASPSVGFLFRLNPIVQGILDPGEAISS